MSTVSAGTINVRLESALNPAAIEGELVLVEINAMSEENSTQNTLNEPPGPVFMPWYRALMELSSLMNLSKYDSNRDPDWIVAAMICASDLLLADGESPSLLSQHKRRSFVEPVYDGDRPDDLSDSEIAEASTWNPEYRHRSRSIDGAALVYREWHHDRGRGDGYTASVRATHRALHRALVGGPVVDALGKECKWCEESSR